MTPRDAFVYVVDDDTSAREAVVGLARAAGFEALAFPSASEFLAFPRTPGRGCLVLDVEMPQLNGLELQQQLNAANDNLPIVFITGYGDVPKSVTAFRHGAADFLTKPFDADGFLAAISRALRPREVPPPAPLSVSPVPALTSQIADTSSIEGIVGDSPVLKEMLRQVIAVADTDTTILIQGETGTGKEGVARALHERSSRRDGRFVKVNCAAIPTGLLESELMGHEKGAFTGATAQRIGRFELAHNGTIFLDEIGEMPLDLQPKLLRLLQEREFERVGGARTVRSNVRVIAATNRNLRAMVAERTFREDLYYRLSVIPITVPPLRERKQDIPALARHIICQLAARLGRPAIDFSPVALERLMAHAWPGNIRELQNIVERAMILSSGGQLQVPDFEPALRVAESDRSVSDLPPARESEGWTGERSSEGLADINKAHILRVLADTNWVIAGPNGAAARLEMKRSTLNFRMRKLGIVRPPLR
jgi:DNA-binding NtrC family response regulator